MTGSNVRSWSRLAITVVLLGLAAGCANETSAGGQPPASGRPAVSSPAATSEATAPQPTRPVSAGGDRNDAYVAAFTEQCESIWSIADAGVLKDPDDGQSEYRVDDCLTDIDPDAGDLFKTAAEAKVSAKDEAIATAGALSATKKLCNAAGTCWAPPGS